MPNDDLPPLPAPWSMSETSPPLDYYTADQMRDYARAALQTRIEADEALMRQALEALTEALSVCRSVSLARDRLVGADKDSPMYAQTQDWCQWARSEVGPVIANSLAALHKRLGDRDD